MRTRTRIVLIGAAATALLAIAAGVGIAAVGDDDEALIGPARDRATEAALAAVGEGEVVEAEVGDDGAAYEVEVRLADGRQVEVELDEAFAVIGSGSDDDGNAGEGAEDGAADDDDA
jgi:hypothetical protein